MNAEIYNTAEVRHLLESAGYSFETACDTEVVLKAYHKWKAGCLEKLNGIFAFAVYDTRRGTLFAARDRIGVKPLFYCKKGRLFAFAIPGTVTLLLPKRALPESELPRLREMLQNTAYYKLIK